MTNEEKQLLLKDLCARLPYGVRIYTKNGNKDTSFVLRISDLNRIFEDDRIDEMYDYDGWKPYLRPMSSMTEEERIEYFGNRMTPWAQNEFGESNTEAIMQYRIDFLLEHHFDYRGLIEKDLALEAPKGMYK